MYKEITRTLINCSLRCAHSGFSLTIKEHRNKRKLNKKHEKSKNNKKTYSNTNK